MNEKWHSVKKLLSTMREYGVWNNWSTMLKKEREGKLTLPRNSVGHRKVTDAMIEEIVTAFLPGGSGEWHYEDK